MIPRVIQSYFVLLAFYFWCCIILGFTPRNPRFHTIGIFASHKDTCICWKFLLFIHFIDSLRLNIRIYIDVSRIHNFWNYHLVKDVTRN